MVWGESASRASAGQAELISLEELLRQGRGGDQAVHCRRPQSDHVCFSQAWESGEERALKLSSFMGGSNLQLFSEEAHGREGEETDVVMASCLLSRV